MTLAGHAARGCVGRVRQGRDPTHQWIGAAVQCRRLHAKFAVDRKKCKSAGIYCSHWPISSERCVNYYNSSEGSQRKPIRWPVSAIARRTHLSPSLSLLSPDTLSSSGGEWSDSVALHCPQKSVVFQGRVEWDYGSSK